MARSSGRITSDLPALKFSEMKNLLMECIKYRANVLIVGGPGSAKTACARAACKELDVEMLTEHSVFNDPTDRKGLPWVDKSLSFAKHYPFEASYKLITATKPTVLCLDDFGQATNAVQASEMPTLLDRTVGGVPISEMVACIIATTNRKQDRAGVGGLLEPVKSRFDTIVEMLVDVEEWVAHEISKGCHETVIGYMRYAGSENKHNVLYDFTPTTDLTNSPNCRGWEAVGMKHMRMNLTQRERQTAVAGAIGHSASADFFTYLEFQKELPSLDLILRDGKNGPIPEKPGVLFSTVSALTYRVKYSQIEHFVDYAVKLHQSGKSEFAMLMAKDIQRRPDSSRLINNTYFEKLLQAVGHLIS